MMKYNKDWLYLLIILFLTFATFYSTLSNGFTNRDDPSYVLDNIIIQNLNLTNIKTIFSSSFVSNYQPLTMISYALEYRFFGAEPFIYHMTNLVLHLLNAMLIYLLTKRLTKSAITAGLCTVLFSIHPLHVESVAWIAERKDVLFALFYLGALNSYFSYTQGDRPRTFFTITILLFLLSLLSKPTAVSFPFVLLIIDFYLRRPLNLKLIYEKIPFFLAALLLGTITLYTQSHLVTREDIVAQDYGMLGRILLSCYALLRYVLQLIIPHQLSCVYPFPVKAEGFYLPILYLSPLILIALWLIVWKLSRYSRHIAFGLLFFVVSIFINLPFLLIGNAYMADRYTYIPSFGLFFIAGIGIDRAIRKFPVSNWRKYTIVIFCLAYITQLCLSSFQRCQVWKNSYTLWSDVIEKHPQFAIAYNNRGSALFEQKKYPQAMQDFNQALKIHPDFAKAYYNRGCIFYRLKNQRIALSEINHSLVLNPNYIEAYYMRGIIYQEMGQDDKALNDFNVFLRLKPNHLQAYSKRGNLLLKKGKYNSAIADFSMAISINRNSADLYNDRGVAYVAKGDHASAAADYSRAIALHPNHQSYYNRGNCHLRMGQYHKAITEYTMALRMNSRHAESYHNRGIARSQMKKHDLAAHDFKMAKILWKGQLKQKKN